jgi:hypothetical protein
MGPGPHLPPPDPGIEIVLATRGYSKGLAQTEGVQGLGRVELVFDSVTVSAQYKNITSPTSDGEAAFGIGWKGKAAGFDLGLGLNWKRLIGLDGQVDPDCWEFIPSVSRKFGPLTGKVSLTYSPDDLGGTGQSAWIEAGATWKLDGKTNLVAAFGRREREGASDYTAFNAGVTRTLFRGVSAELRYYDTARSSLGEPFHARFVGALRGKF